MFKAKSEAFTFFLVSTFIFLACILFLTLCATNVLEDKVAFSIIWGGLFSIYSCLLVIASLNLIIKTKLSKKAILFFFMFWIRLGIYVLILLVPILFGESYFNLLLVLATCGVILLLFPWIYFFVSRVIK